MVIRSQSGARAPALPKTSCQPEDAQAIRDHFNSASQAGDVMLIGGMFTLLGAVSTVVGLAAAVEGEASWLTAAGVAAATSGAAAFTGLALRSARSEMRAGRELNEKTQCFTPEELNAVFQGAIR